MNKKEIEEAYEKFCDSEDRIGTDWEIRSFTAGANWMQEKIMDEAAKGFEEWVKARYEKMDCQIFANVDEAMSFHKKIHPFQAWQAAKLSSAKEIEQLKQRLAEYEKEVLCGGCNDIVLENGKCDVCNWAKISAEKGEINEEI